MALDNPKPQADTTTAIQVDSPESGTAARKMYSAEALDTVRREWGPWCRALTYVEEDARAATDHVIAYLQVGLGAEVVAALIRIRFGSEDPFYRARVEWERAYTERARTDAAELRTRGVISAKASVALQREYSARLAALGTWADPINPRAAAPVAAKAEAVATGSVPAGEHPVAAPPESIRSISLRDLFAEHSVLILASLGAFLLVVATVLFELYGTIGLGGTVRLAAVVALDLIFGSAGYFAHRQQRLRSVGQIYIALAAVLLPLVGVAAWTFLELGAHGITTYQSIAVTGAACAVVYGALAYRLGLRAYGEMAGLAIFAAAFGLSGAVGGDHWLSVGLALTPLAYAMWERLLPDRVFSHFQWFAHATALVSLSAALRFDPTSWLLTATLGALAVAYLAWQAVAAHQSRAWAGEAAVVLAATAAVGPLGLSSYHYALPMVVGIPLVALARSSDRLGVAGRLYRAHPAHLHLAVLAGIGLATAENVNGAEWPLPASLWIAVALYLADFWLGRTEITGYALRAALPLAVAATGRTAGLGAWTASLTAAATLAYLIPLALPRSLGPLTRRASVFFYASVGLVVVELFDASVGSGRWEIPVALLVGAAALAGASELGAVRYSALAARGLFSLAWFAGVDALGAQGWRGPFDALLALVYTAVAQVRAAGRHFVAVAGRRWFVHGAALAALLLCFAGPDGLLWWRLAAAFGLLAVAYWWQAILRAEPEMPWLAWASLASAAAALALAIIPERWQGTAIVGAALVLTGGWAVVRRPLRRTKLEMGGLPVLGMLGLAGAALTLRQDLPQWSQATAALLSGGFLLAWSRLRDDPPELRQSLRSGAAALSVAGVLLGAAVLRLDAAFAGLIAISIAAAHVEWNVRAKGEVERIYALVAVLAMGPVVYFWQYGDALPALVAAEFATLAALTLMAGVRRRQWFLAYPAAVLLAPSLHLAFTTQGLVRNVEAEEIAMAVLAWVIGTVGLVVRRRSGPRWALATEAGGVTIALGALLSMTAHGRADPAGIALLAYAPLVYAAGMQERERWVLPGAAAVALGGAVTLLYAHGADTTLYPAASGVLGLVVWGAGRMAFGRLGRHAVVDMHRYVGIGLLAVSGLAGFAFPDRTGPSSLGSTLATGAMLITGGVLWLDARTFGFRPNFYVALIGATTAGFFAARDLSFRSWELVLPGLGLIACGILLRHEAEFQLRQAWRQLIVSIGLALLMGWAAVLTVTGDPWWLVALLIEGAASVGAGIAVRSRVLLAGGGAALALASLRALLSVAQAGYLFAAFAAVAVVLLAVATALAVGRDRYIIGARTMREQIAQWESGDIATGRAGSVSSAAVTAVSATNVPMTWVILLAVAIVVAAQATAVGFMWTQSTSSGSGKGAYAPQLAATVDSSDLVTMTVSRFPPGVEVDFFIDGHRLTSTTTDANGDGVASGVEAMSSGARVTIWACYDPQASDCPAQVTTTAP